MKTSASHLADSLARHAEAVCRRYLSNGRRYGGYWIVGDVRNTPGASTFVRLGSRGPGNGAVGKWSDGATGEHGDLLDVIRETCGLNRFHDVADEARRFLDLPRPAPEAIVKPRNSPPRELSPAKRLVRFCRPIAGTLAEAYLWRRGVTNFDGTHSLQFHPACFYRPNGSAETQRWPALIGVVTDLNGGVTGVHRTWLDPDLMAPDHGKAPIENPKRSLGDIWTHAVRFGIVAEVIAAGEGIETILSLRSALPALPMIAALSASHLAAVAFPPLLRRLYIASDADPAGRRAAAALAVRAREAGIEAIVLLPTRNDFNDDLIAMGVDGLRGTLGPQLAPGDFSRFMSLSRQPGGTSLPRRQGSANFGPTITSARLVFRGAAPPAFFRGRVIRRASRAGNGFGRLFSGGGQARLSIARQNSRPPPSYASLRPFAWGSGCQPGSPARLSRL